MPAFLARLRPFSAVLLTGGLVALVALPPFVSASGRAMLYAAFASVCHQMDARSFHLHGHAFAVCHRCTGIYAGLLAGALLWPLARGAGVWLQRHAVRLLLLSLVPATVDWALGATGLWANTPLSQALTGGVFGAVAGLYLARGLTGADAPLPPAMQTEGVAP